MWRKAVLISVTCMFFSVLLLLFMSAKWMQRCRQLSPEWPKICLARIDPIISIITRTHHFNALMLYTQIQPFSAYWTYLLGYDHPTTYLILLQNDTEMRANGGFFGSYAVLTMTEGKPDIRFQDIYVPDGQLGGGHVEAPLPIEEAFRKGGFYLRDSDWDPDFVRSSRTIRWFFDKGGEITPDVLMTINLSTIKKILHVVGLIKIPDYNVDLTEDTLFQTLQAKVETDFFPGSTQKRDILVSVGHTFMAQLTHLPLAQKIEIADIVWKEVLYKNILFNSTNSDLQKLLEEKNMAGQLQYPVCADGEGRCALDTFLSVEANLGANKANGYTERKTTHTITSQGDSVSHMIDIVYTNTSKEENPKLPDFFGGNYIQYVRFYIPKIASHVQVKAEPTDPTTLSYYPTPYTTDPTRLDISTDDNFTVIGFFHITKADTMSQIHLNYDLPASAKTYELHILKQHGMPLSPQQIIFGSTHAETSLEDDYVFSTTK